jgi:Phytochelatin synthase
MKFLQINLAKDYLPTLLIGTVIASGSAIAQTLPLTENLINFNSEQGEKLLVESKSRTDFFPLTSQFITQDNQAYCGVASIVMVLNSLGISAPEASQYKPFKIFTQQNLFDLEKTKKITTAEVVSREGMTLEQIAGLISSYDVQAQVYHAADSSVDEFRKLAINNLKQPNNYIIINYLRKAIGQETGGHISPLAAYNEATDRFLILDVSRYKYPPIWVKAADLWKAMNTTDTSVNKTRGFVVISKNSR